MMAANQSLESKRVLDPAGACGRTANRPGDPRAPVHSRPPRPPGSLPRSSSGPISVARAHLIATAVAAVWVGLVCVTRFAIAKSFARLYASRPVVWTRMFRGGLVLSSTTWGVGGALLLAAGHFDREAWLVLMTLAGISAGAVVSLSGDLTLLRVHVVLMLVPGFVAGMLFMPDAPRIVGGFAVVVAAVAAFLWIQGASIHRSFFDGLVTAKLLERHAAEIEEARLASVAANRAKSSSWQT